MTLSNQGFTLIELMITVGIIGVLAAVALPAYQDYTIKAQATEGIALFNGLKVEAALYFSHNGTLAGWDPQNSFAYSKLQGSYVSSATINTSGNLVIRFGNRANEKIANFGLSFMPVDSGNNLNWRCMAPGWKKNYVPNGCVAT